MKNLRNLRRIISIQCKATKMCDFEKKHFCLHDTAQRAFFMQQLTALSKHHISFQRNRLRSGRSCGCNSSQGPRLLCTVALPRKFKVGTPQGLSLGYSCLIPGCSHFLSSCLPVGLWFLFLDCDLGCFGILTTLGEWEMWFPAIFQTGHHLTDPL